ncbi:hypothetical protein [Albimonas pacifica]|uniref:Outer membrane beta-barrel protein n=1 Tax=Albimonas pacifica TaxID=1114924 RepID=A0A1I3F6N4_9RHOB|nr:hypothetical protein [Albimonas pacifica]SFI06868.1 hypothetical protein SAMN05216258_10496 [Albimonas pacifica]
MPRALTGFSLPGPDLPGAGAAAPARRGRLRRLAQGGAAVGAAAAAALAAAPSDAGDRTLTGRLTQTFLGDTNLQVDRGGTVGGGRSEGEAAVGSRSRLALDYRDATTSSLFTFGGVIDYDIYTGSENDDISGLFPDLRAGYSLRGARSSLQLTAFGSAQPIDTLDSSGFSFFDPGVEPTPIDPTDPDPGTPNATLNRTDAIRTIYGFGVTANERINSRDSTNFSVSVQRRDFIDGTRALTPSNQLSMGMGWQRQVSSRIGVGLSYNSSVLKAEGAQDTETYTFSLSPTLSYAATPQKTFSLSLGPQYSISDRKQPLPGGTLVPDVGYTIGLRAAAGMTYAYDNVRTAFSLNQSVTPNDDGDAVNRTTISGSLTQRISAATSLASRVGVSIETPLDEGSAGVSEETLSFDYAATLRHDVNRFTALDFTLGARLRDDGQDRDVVLSTGAGYGYRLTEDTGLRLGYEFRLPMGDIDDQDSSHRVSLSLTHDFTLLP